MNLQRERIVAAFESLKTLLCDMGMFVEGSEGNGVFARYWGNRRIRQLATFRNGLQDGLEVRRFGPVNPAHFGHYKNGVPFGEVLKYLANGKLMEHLLVDDGIKIPYSEEEARNFEGYLVSGEDEELFRKYDLYFAKEVFM